MGRRGGAAAARSAGRLVALFTLERDKTLCSPSAGRTPHLGYDVDGGLGRDVTQPDNGLATSGPPQWHTCRCALAPEDGTVFLADCVAGNNREIGCRRWPVRWPDKTSVSYAISIRNDRFLDMIAAKQPATGRQFCHVISQKNWCKLLTEIAAAKPDTKRHCARSTGR
jgi:hypothetical protein